ncbi:cell cycle checkpoint protein RAD1 [Mucor ambiguus]|uniref:Cell cycle checkpoint protein RAD1 n=1 Tax=Mucor ambiguus TaxID=91626 RepID=A0A0C9MLE4_9FUNG|nr:cell cycle checkpoint protein RAD1 [Mucor ambiguus]
MDYTIDDTVLFYAVIKNVKHVLKLIKALEFKNVVSLYIHDEGFILTVEDQRAVKAMAYFKLHLFQIFNLREGVNVPALGLPVDVLSNGLRIMLPASEATNVLQGANDYCEVIYDGTGSRLIRESNSLQRQTMKCELIPFEPDEESTQLQFEESSNEESQRMIMKSVWFKDLMNDLDSGYNKVSLTMSPNDPPFRVVAEGTDLLTEADCPQDSEPFINFVCNRELTFSYLYAHIVQCKRALDLSNEVSLEMYSNGALRLFFQIEGPLGKLDTIQFNFLPSTNIT